MALAARHTAIGLSLFGMLHKPTLQLRSKFGSTTNRPLRSDILDDQKLEMANGVTVALLQKVRELVEPHLDEPDDDRVVLFAAGNRRSFAILHRSSSPEEDRRQFQDNAADFDENLVARQAELLEEVGD